MSVVVAISRVAAMKGLATLRPSAAQCVEPIARQVEEVFPPASGEEEDARRESPRHRGRESHNSPCHERPSCQHREREKEFRTPCPHRQRKTPEGAHEGSHENTAWICG